MEIDERDINDDDYYKYVRNSSIKAALSLFAIIILFSISVLFLVEKTDVFFGTDLYGENSRQTDTYAVAYMEYSCESFDIKVVNADACDGSIGIDVDITNKSQHSVDLDKNDFSLIKYVHNGKELRMVSYPQAYSGCTILQPGENSIVSLSFAADTVVPDDLDLSYSLCFDCCKNERPACIVLCYKMADE